MSEEEKKLKQKEYMKKWKEKNRERKKANDAIYREKNREAINARKREKYIENRDVVLEQRRIKREKLKMNPEEYEKALEKEKLRQRVRRKEEKEIKFNNFISEVLNSVENQIKKVGDTSKA